MKVQLSNTPTIFIVIAIALSVCYAQQQDMILNGGFEQDTDSDGMADHWQFSADEGVVAVWSRDDGFAGGFSQKLSCTEFTARSSASHAMLCQLDTVKLEKGKWYKISFAARQQGIPGGAVHLAISDTKAWQNCGLQESFRANRKWKQFEFVFRAAQTISDHVRLQFWYTSTGTFWLDDAKLEPSQPLKEKFTEIVPPTTSVNLIPNSSFECGATGWGSIADLPGWGGNLNRLVGSVDTAASKFHKSSFKIELTPETTPVFYFDYFSLYRVPVKAPLLANRGWITVEPGAEYTLSAYMKADSSDLFGVLSARQAFRGSLRKQVHLTTSWQLYSFTFRPQSTQLFVALGLDLDASEQDAGTIWIDAVQLEKNPQATTHQPTSPVELGVETKQSGNLYPYGSQPKMTARIFNDSDAPKRVDLHIRTTDFDDVLVHQTNANILVAPHKHAELPLEAGVTKKGFYRLHVESRNAEVILTRTIRFAIITPYKHADSLFGMNHAYPWPQMLELSKQIGLCWFRDWSLKWNDVEPEKGTFEFTECDSQIDHVLDRDLKVLPVLPFPSANWSSTAPKDSSDIMDRIARMPKDLDEFATYVRHTVKHYQKRLSVWEILNEPIYTSYALPRTKGYQVTDYVRLLRVAYKAIKEADPTALVIGGIAGSPTTYTREFIDANGLDYVDVLNLHTYPGLMAPDAYEEPLQKLRDRMRSAGRDIPIWFTEGAYYADDDKPSEPYSSNWLKPVDSEAEAAEWQVKFNTLLLAYGAEKIIYHSGTPGSLNNESLSGIFFEWAGAPRKMLVTQSAMANLLAPPIRSLGPIESPKTFKAYGFESLDRTVIVVWTNEDTDSMSISVPENWKTIDIQGNELNYNKVAVTERPVYFVAKGTKLQKLPW